MEIALHEKINKFSLRSLIIICLILLVAAYILLKIDVSFHQRHLENALLRLNMLSGVDEAKNELEALNSFITQARDSDIPIGVLLKKISNIASEEIFFNEFKLGPESKSGSISGYIKWTGVNPDTILNKFINQLNNSGYVKDAAIYSVERSSKDGSDINTFLIVFKLP